MSVTLYAADHPTAMQRADTIGGMTVLDETGASVRLDTLWSTGPAVLVFVRHFG